MLRPIRTLIPILALLATFSTPQISSSQEAKQSSPASASKDDSSSKDDSAINDEEGTRWIPLLQSDSLEGWQSTNFGGEGDVEVEDGVLKMSSGQPLTGISFKGKDFPKENFEMRWSARRTDGSDFFSGVTFPVGDQFATFVCGGWGGGLVGLSSINGNDASENQTAKFMSFKNKQWYAFRVQVNATHVSAWIDDEEVFKVDREGTKFSLRAEVLKSRPLGYCAFQSKIEAKEWSYRVLR